MYFKDIGYLCREKKSFDRHNRPKTSYDKISIYCNIKSIGMTEFYQASSVGFKPEIKVEIRNVDLTDISHFEYNGKLYKILRIYKKEDIVELVLTSMVINNE